MAGIDVLTAAAGESYDACQWCSHPCMTEMRVPGAGRDVESFLFWADRFLPDLVPADLLLCRPVRRAKRQTGNWFER